MMNINNKNTSSTSFIGRDESSNGNTLVKPVAIKSSSPSNIGYNGDGNSIQSNPVVLRDHNSVSSDGELSGFHKVNVDSPGSVAIAYSSDQSHDIITHPKISGFMNWIPLDRTSEYICKIFKILRITNEASVNMRNAFIERRNVSRPHNMAYITIPANSIIDSTQGKMFLDGIQSENYQIVLDCGNEHLLSSWQYRVYPIKKKLLPSEVPSTDLPRLGTITITTMDAIITSHVPNDVASPRSLPRPLDVRNGVGILSDNLSDVSSIAHSESYAANDTLNQTDHNIILSTTTKTFANVVAKVNNGSANLYGNGINTFRNKNWADFSVSDEDNNSHITNTSCTYEKLEKLNVDKLDVEKPHNESLIDDNLKLTENIKELFEKKARIVSSIQEECEEAFAKWKICKDSLERAKKDQAQYQQIHDLIIGIKPDIDDTEIDSGKNEYDTEDKELFINTNNTPHYDNVGDGASSSTYDNNYMIDPHSGQVTPILYYQPNMDGTYSPVLPVPSHNWMQYNNSYGGPSTTQYNNDMFEQNQNIVSTPAVTPTDNISRKHNIHHEKVNHQHEVKHEVKHEVNHEVKHEVNIDGDTKKTVSCEELHKKETIDNHDTNNKDQITEASTNSDDDNIMMQNLMKHLCKEFIDVNNISSDQLKQFLQMKKE